jgi:hypothetical protein
MVSEGRRKEFHEVVYDDEKAGGKEQTMKCQKACFQTTNKGKLQTTLTWEMKADKDKQQ